MTIARASSLLPILAVAALSAGCGKMADNAQRSAENSFRAANNSDILLQTSINAYGDGRQGGSRARRLEELKRLEDSKGFDGKQVAASAYFCAYEFQLWKDDGAKDDTDSKREALFAEAAAEFLKTARDYSVPLESGDPQPNFLALATTMHKISLRQKDASARFGFQERSMLDLLHDGLAPRAKLAAAPKGLADLKPHQIEVLKEEEVAAGLIQARVGAFVGSVLNAIVATEELGAVATGAAKSWNPKLTALSNPVRLADFSARVKSARASKASLGAAGLGAPLADKIRFALATMEVPAGIAAPVAELLEGLKTFAK